jgi:cytochrome c2
MTSDVTIDLTTLLKGKEALGRRVSIEYDPLFQTRKDYKGFPVKNLLDSVVQINHTNIQQTLLILECKDGYRPIMDLSRIYAAGNAYIVFKDEAVPDEKHWPDSLNAMLSPYYMVWTGIEKEDPEYAWPYGLVKITLTDAKSTYAKIYPIADSSFRAGFLLFKKHCLTCHSINNIGGQMGPEFNVPRNITEYWNSEDIIAFTKNPGSYRRDSKMPAITYLKESDYRSLVDYLKFMKDHKVNPN